MRDIIRMVVVLTVICAISGLALSAVQDLTKDTIEYQKLKKQITAAQAVLKGVDNDPGKDRKTLVVGKDKRGRDVKLMVFRGKKGGATSAVAFKTDFKGYHGNVHVLTAIDVKANKIIGIEIVDQSETPGRGNKILEPSFKQPFAGKATDKKIAKGDIKPLSGATVSTVAVLGAVNQALSYYKKFKSQMIK